MGAAKYEAWRSILALYPTHEAIEGGMDGRSVYAGFLGEYAGRFGGWRTKKGIIGQGSRDMGRERCLAGAGEAMHGEMLPPRYRFMDGRTRCLLICCQAETNRCRSVPPRPGSFSRQRQCAFVV